MLPRACIAARACAGTGVLLARPRRAAAGLQLRDAKHSLGTAHDGTADISRTKLLKNDLEMKLMLKCTLDWSTGTWPTHT